MIEKTDIKHIAKAIGNGSRIHMLSLLMEGRALTAKELSYGVGIDPATATSHLSLLLSTGLIHCIKQGKFKYFSLANSEVALLIETMITLTPNDKQIRKLPTNELCEARYCYDHLAGKLGVQIYDKLISGNIISLKENIVRVTHYGQDFFNSIGIDIELLKRHHRKLAYPCLDWSERRYHLAGSLGAAIAQYFIDNEWVLRKKNTREIIITIKGKNQIESLIDYRKFHS